MICSDAFLAHDPEGADRSFDSLDSRLDVEDWEGGCWRATGSS